MTIALGRPPLRREVESEMAGRDRWNGRVIAQPMQYSFPPAPTRRDGPRPEFSESRWAAIEFGGSSGARSADDFLDCASSERERHQTSFPFFAL
jgi:hypothetical protein